VARLMRAAGLVAPAQASSTTPTVGVNLPRPPTGRCSPRGA
jgi:hypothetical protein